MHGWMACLQQMALVLGLDQPTPPLAQPHLDFLLITYIKGTKHGKTHNQQSPNNITQTTFTSGLYYHYVSCVVRFCWVDNFYFIICMWDYAFIKPNLASQCD